MARTAWGEKKPLAEAAGLQLVRLASRHSCGSGARCRAELDVSRPEVRQALAGCLPQTSCIASAMSCATKSRAREKQPGPPPLRSVEFPRALPGLSNHNLLRVSQELLL